jgi:hypothetical protein
VDIAPVQAHEIARTGPWHVWLLMAADDDTNDCS